MQGLRKADGPMRSHVGGIQEISARNPDGVGKTTIQEYRVADAFACMRTNCETTGCVHETDVSGVDDTKTNFGG